MLNHTLQLSHQPGKGINQGLEFESFVHFLFDTHNHSLIDKRSAALYPVSAYDPHLVYQTNKENARFALVCRFRQSDYRHKYTWAEAFQLLHYRRFEERTGIPVFIVIGLGGLPSKPTSLFIIPFETISDTATLTVNRMCEYERNLTEDRFLFDAEDKKFA